MQSNPSIPPSFGGYNETCKRKRADNDTGLLPDSDKESQITKRQESVPYFNRSKAAYSRVYFPRNESLNDESNEENSKECRWTDSLVRQSIYANDKKFDRLPFQGHQSAIHTNNTPRARNLSASPTLSKAPAQCSSASADAAVRLQTTKESKVTQNGTVNVLDRKRHFMYTPGDAIKKRMEKYVSDINRLFDSMRSDGDCWLYPSPLSARSNGRPKGNIPCAFNWTDSSGTHKLRVNFGLVALIVERQLVEEQMRGYVSESWHLSHLCGNWTCCNWRHMTVESGRTNVSRNQCFRSAGLCSHQPPCMKHRKRQFPVTVDISNHIKSAINSVSSDGAAAKGSQSSDFTAVGWGCGICGEDTLCFGSERICRSLTSITKSQEALEKLDLRTQPNDEVREAITYLRKIIADLSREKGGSCETALERWLIKLE